MLRERELEMQLCDCGYLGRDPIDIIGRQVPLLHGILDVLAIRTIDLGWKETYLVRQILAIELKAVPLQEKHIGQVLRYAADLRMLLDYLVLAHPCTPKAWDLKWEFFDGAKTHDARGAGPRIAPVLIAPEISPLLAHTCQGAGIETYEVAKDGSSICVYGKMCELDFEEMSHAPWAHTIATAFYEDFDDEVESEYETALLGLFGGSYVNE